MPRVADGKEVDLDQAVLETSECFCKSEKAQGVSHSRLACKPIRACESRRIRGVLTVAFSFGVSFDQGFTNYKHVERVIQSAQWPIFQQDCTQGADSQQVR